MPKKYVVTLTEEEREELAALVTKGKSAARTLTHARILLKADQSPDGPAWPDRLIRETLEVGLCTVMRVRERFVEEGLESALRPRKPALLPRPRKLDGHQEAQLIVLACSKAPQGRAQWTMQLLADRMVELEFVESLSHETVRRTLKKTKLSLG